MKIITFFCLLTLLYCENISKADSAKVKISVAANNISNNEKIYITGNQKKLGNWKPDVVEFNRIDDSTFTLEFLFPLNKKIEYKLTKGSWSTEEINADGTAPSNHILVVKKDTALIHYVNIWGNAVPPEPVGQITGDVEYLHGIKTRDELLPRDIVVWLPPGYNQNTSERYPVLYMHDGQNIIDPATSTLGIDWQIDEMADSLIRNNKIEPLIIVGVYSTQNRTIEYSENDTSYAYIDFLINDLKPIIDENFRTKGDKENTAVAGSSMGGLISFMIAWRRPDVFSKAACLSPAFKIDRFNIVDNVEAYHGTKKDIQLYIDNGGVDLEDSLQSGIDDMLLALQNQGYTEGVDFVWFKDEDAVHNETDWAKRSWRFLKLFFKKGE